MLFSDIFFELFPDREVIPFDKLQREFFALGFDGRQCRERLHELIGSLKLDAEWFDLDAVGKGGVTATDKLVFQHFGKDAQWLWKMWTPQRRAVTFTMDAAEVESAGDIIRLGTHEENPEHFRNECVNAMNKAVVDWLCPPDAVKESPQTEVWPLIDEPGIYRREHASLVLRSRTTTIVADPQGYKGGWTTNGGRFPDEASDFKVDAVVITHSHGDHWHLPSILRMAHSRQMPVIVPAVSRPNLLCPEDFASSLRLAGQNVTDPAWWSTVEVGDFIIDVLPFYGEQPLRSRPGVCNDARNWGNCYRFTCPDFSAAILVESGVDPLGDMVGVLEKSFEARGPLDVLLSSCFDFAEGFNTGVPMYFLTVPLEYLREFHLNPKNRQSMTLGPRGVASACEVTRSRYFLPYAHGFRGISRPPFRPRGDEQPEEQALDLIRRNVSTEVLSWMPGDLARIQDHKLEIVRLNRASPI